VPIGAVNPGLEYRILDGELCVRGAQRFDGYLDPADDAGRFVPDEAPVLRSHWYRTGDRVSGADGALVHLGRVDGQVKIRGNRVELGEVEAALRADDRVREAAVLALPSGDGGLDLAAAYTGTPDAGQDLVAALLAALPPYMVPRAVLHLPELPLNANGKVDRGRLGGWIAERLDAGPADHVAPEDPVQVTLAELWEEVLGTGRIGAGDDFFARGGHSLRAVHLAFRINETFGVEVALHRLLDAPTLGAMAELITGELLAGPDALLVMDEVASLSDDEVHALLGGGGLR
jgi:aryl carrier-like protein